MQKYDTVLVACSSAAGLNLPTDLGSYYKLFFQQNIMGVESYRIKSLSIPNTFYTIKANALVFGLQGDVSGHVSFALPAANYSADQLSTYIVAQFLAVTGTTISVSFTSPDFKVIIQRTAGTDNTIAISATELALAGMTSILGFSAAIPANTTLTAQQIFNITGPSQLLVQSATLNPGYNMISKNGKYVRSNVIFQTWASGNGKDYRINQIPGDFCSLANVTNLASLDLYLTDENEDPIDLNGYPWNIAIEFRTQKNE